jgi:hypothetical protein
MHGFMNIDPLNDQLNPICHLLALLGAHQFLHVSRIRVILVDMVSLRGALFRRNTDCWVAVPVPHWVWQTFAVNKCILSDHGYILTPRKDLAYGRNDGCRIYPVF